MSSRLARQQRAFRDSILSGGSGFAGEVLDDAGLDARARLGIYADAYRLRLTEALATDFVALRAHLGPERFERLSLAYIGAHPSDHWSLRRVGRRLGAFLADRAPWRETPFLSELARFEWALVEAFDAADGPVLQPRDLVAIPPARWPELVFRPHASVQRLDLAWNAPAVWKAVKDEVPAPERAPQPLGWLIWRQGLQDYFRPLPVEEACALDALMRGETFGAICETLLEWTDAQHAPARAAGLLKLWSADGLLGAWSLA